MTAPDRVEALVWGVTVSIVIAKELHFTEQRFITFVRHAWRVGEQHVRPVESELRQSLSGLTRDAEARH